MNLSIYNPSVYFPQNSTRNGFTWWTGEWFYMINWAIHCKEMQWIMHMWTTNVKWTSDKQEVFINIICIWTFIYLFNLSKIWFRILTKYIAFKTFFELKIMYWSLLNTLYLFTDYLVDQRPYLFSLLIHTIKCKKRL